MSMINLMLSGVENDIFTTPTHCLGQIKNVCFGVTGLKILGKVGTQILFIFFLKSFFTFQNA